MKTTENVNNQDRATIITLNPNPVAQAFIYSGEQRAKIVQLISHGFLRFEPASFFTLYNIFRTQFRSPVCSIIQLLQDRPA